MPVLSVPVSLRARIARVFERALAVAAVSAAVMLGALAFTDDGPASPNTCSRSLRGHTERVDVSTTGEESNGVTSRGPLSPTGRFVAFSSTATNLVPDDTNGVEDVFVRDRLMDETIRVSVGAAGEQSNGASYLPLLSGDGSLVAFRSVATNLAAGPQERIENFYVHDLVTGTTVSVPLGPTGENQRRPIPGPDLEDNSRCNSWCVNAMSADGGVFALTSSSSALVRNDRNGVLDVFVIAGGRTIRVSMGPRGEADDFNEGATISADGHVVAFRSAANNLVKGDTNGVADVFVRDWVKGVTERVSVSSSGEQAARTSFRGMISGDGRFVGFRSKAGNLVLNDTNRAIDAFVHDRLTGKTKRVSVAGDGSQARAAGLSTNARELQFVSRPFLSPRGRFAAFTSRAKKIVPGDTNGHADVFVHDLKTRRTARASVADNGRQATSDSRITGISADGRVIGFMSSAGNLVAGDNNRLRDYFVRVRPAAARCGVRQTQ